MEALRKPFQPEERRKQILTDDAIWAAISWYAPVARADLIEGRRVIPSTYFTNPQVFRPHNEINLLFVR